MNWLEKLMDSLATGKYADDLKPLAWAAAIVAVLVALAVLAAGCAAPTQALSAPPAPALKAVGIGTLATSACEAAVAPHVTRLAASRRQAAQLLDAQRLTLQQAVLVQALADSAREILSGACGQQRNTVPVQRIAEAQARQKDIDTILEAAR